MKKFIPIVLFMASVAQAGVVKVAVYPLHHPKKDFHAAKKTVKALAKAVYNL